MEETQLLIFDIIKNVVTHIISFYIFFKIRDEEILKPKKILGTIINAVIGTTIFVTLNGKINSEYILIIDFFVNYAMANILTDSLNRKSIVTSMLISIALTKIIYAIITFIVIFASVIILKTATDKAIGIEIIVLMITSFVCYKMFKIRRLSKGMQFLKEKINDEYLDVIMINVSVVVIFVYTLYTLYDVEGLKEVSIIFVFVAVIMFVMIRKVMKLAYSEQQLERYFKEDEQIIAEMTEEKQKNEKEKYEISKINHEFSKKIKALEVKENFSAKSNVEFGAENEILERINNLSNSYAEKLQEIKGIDNIAKTNVPEIDSSFKYIQNEAAKANIQFNLEVNCSVEKLTKDIISKDKLSTLINDLGTDAIIAVNHNSTNFKSIVAIINKKDEVYSFSMADTGIEFEIETLKKLGTERITTHKDEGGSGIGFMTVFEILKETGASLIIEEKGKESKTNYTKNIIIKFDGKNQYRIRTYRAKEILSQIRDNRVIIEKLDK